MHALKTHTGAENGGPRPGRKVSVAAVVGGNVNTLHSQPVENATGNKLLFIYSLTSFWSNGSRLCVLARRQEVRRASERLEKWIRDQDMIAFAKRSHWDATHVKHALETGREAAFEQKRSVWSVSGWRLRPWNELQPPPPPCWSNHSHNFQRNKLTFDASFFRV